MTRAYVDANVFLYALGEDSAYREPCRALIDGFAEGRVAAETGVRTLEEVVHHRRRRGDGHATAHGRRVATLCTTVHGLDRDRALDALELVERHPALDTGDAIHAATAISAGLALIVSGDRAFDEVAGLIRLDPLDRAAMATLLSE